MAEIVWRVEKTMYAIVVGLLGELLEEPEWTDRYYSLLDDLKSLPGFPNEMDEEMDFLIIEEIPTPTVSVPRLN